MKARWRRYAKYLPVSSAVVLLIVLGYFNRSFKQPPREVGNNPDHFRLWATNSEYSYTFIYDPLAADNWLREAAVWSSNALFDVER
jgi:hypothetical protein